VGAGDIYLPLQICGGGMMGQYYIPVLMNTDSHENRRQLLSHNYHNGLKLMEHSWCGNNFVNAVVALMKMRGKQRLVWLGDYATRGEDMPLQGYGGSLYDVNAYSAFHKAVWEKNMKGGGSVIPVEVEDYCIVNHTKGVFIDMVKYKRIAPSQYDDDPFW
jgi:hypothetical protein